MSMLDAQHRARRRRLEGGLMLSMALAVTVLGATLYVARFAAIVTIAGALFGR